MTCKSAQELIEMDPAQAQTEVREHLENCPDCRGLMEDLTSLRNTVREQAPYYTAPPGLRRRILAQARGARPVPWNWLAIAASLLLIASAIGNVLLLRSRTSPQEILAANIVSNHVRSLAGTHLLDVPSSDQHTVKPWFNGKLDFSPEVKDLTSYGFPLTGGRLEYVDGRPAAALVFERRKHIINLFTWPSLDASGETQSTRNGYHLIQWTKDGMTYWAVSDVNESDLQKFVQLYHN